MDYETYIKNFGDRKIPKSMEKLLRLNKNLDELVHELDMAGIYFRFMESSDVVCGGKVIKSLLGIATNGCGDQFAFWLDDDELELENTPIVGVGSGIYSVIANNFDDLILLLAAVGDLSPGGIDIEDEEDELKPNLIFDNFMTQLTQGMQPNELERFIKTTQQLEPDPFFDKFIAKLAKGMEPNELEELNNMRREFDNLEKDMKFRRAEFILKMGIQLPEDPEELYLQAVESHPNFEEWLEPQIPD